MNTKYTLLIVIILLLTVTAYWELYTYPIAKTHTAEMPIVEIETQTETQIKTAQLPNFSAWLWDSPDIFTKDDLIKMFQLAQSEKITMIYLRMDDYADIYKIKDGNKKITRIKKLNDAAQQFIALAREYNIKVQALGGNTGWADPSERSYPDLFFDGVLNYNNSNIEDQFVGIQFDVESYNSAAYKKNKNQTLTNYLDFVQEMIDKKQKNTATVKNNFYLGFAIPFWYDNENNNGVALNWREFGLKPVAYHLFDILNKTTGGYVVLMDYRNYAVGIDGSIENARNEIEYASKNSPEIKIIIGQETTNVSPSKITFYNTSKEIFRGEVSKIIEAFKFYNVFTGIAIHHLSSYIDL